jgi:hypothetical protein
MPHNTSLNLTRYVGASRLVARRLALLHGLPQVKPSHSL